MGCGTEKVCLSWDQRNITKDNSKMISQMVQEYKNLRTAVITKEIGKMVIGKDSGS